MTINDSNWQFLHDATGLSLPFNEMYFRYLRDLGYEGTLQDMIAASGLGLNSSGWKNPASRRESIPSLGLNFSTAQYTADGSPIASPLSLTRAATAWRTASDGVTVSAFTNDVPRIDSRGLYLERERTRYSIWSTNQVNWTVVTSATKLADTAIGLITPVIIGSGGSTSSMLSSNTNISLTAGQKVYPVEVYKAGTSGRNRLRISNTAALLSTLTGTVDNMAVADSAAGAWSDLLNTDLGDWSKVEATFTAGTTEAGYRLREGPDSAVAGQTVIVAWSQMASLPGEIILGTQTAAATVPQDQASINLTSYSVTGTVVKFTSDYFVTAATILNIEDTLGTSSAVLSVGTNGTLTATLTIAGVEAASIPLGTINARQEYTVGLQWRNNVLSGYVNGGMLATDSFIGTMPDVTLAELFLTGGSNITIPEVNFYSEAI